MEWLLRKLNRFLFLWRSVSETQYIVLIEDNRPSREELLPGICLHCSKRFKPILCDKSLFYASIGFCHNGGLITNMEYMPLHKNIWQIKLTINDNITCPYALEHLVLINKYSKDEK